MLELNQIHCMNCIDGLKQMDSESVHCCVTSPPYWNLRDYGVNGQIGLESTLELYIEKMVDVFREVRRVMRKDGTVWVNIGDSYAGSYAGMGDKKTNSKGNTASRNCKAGVTPAGLKPKDLIGIPWRVAFALQEDGWYLRSDIVWHKTNTMPESVTDRPTRAHEYIFLFSKSARYYYNAEAIKEPIAAASIQRLSQDIEHQIGSTRANAGAKTNGNMKAVIGKGNRKTFRGGGIYTNSQSFLNSAKVENDSVGNTVNETLMRNKRTVWPVATAQFSEAHFATYPPKLIEPCILAGCPKDGIVLDPFMGSGTTAMVAMQLQRNYIGFELNPEYIKIAERSRLSNVQQRIV